MKNMVTLSRKWLVVAAFGRKNTRDSVGNHMPAKGIQQTHDNQKKLLVDGAVACRPAASVNAFATIAAKAADAGNAAW